MTSLTKLFTPSLLALLLLAANGVFAYPIDDETPPVTSRVARISLIRGDVQVRRGGSAEWERATLNLPLVEGDEITTGDESRVEIQFNVHTHARLDGRSYLHLAMLRDEGIVLSVSEGRMIVRASEFDKERSYVEIDAPRTTVAIQRSGMYRVDTGRRDAGDIRVAATEGGEARIYTDASGFTLRTGRSARIFIDGGNAGEWDVAEASRFVDEFESWSLDRDAAIARRIREAHYDRYYDRDIYGADELSEHGEWIYTRRYGYVWKPYSSATRIYADWSPYRYGHWRWVPPFGWTWVNDEPWGWATYHHGRWVWLDGHWAWTPYGRYRTSRSWWSPALVVVTVINRNICWYPLPYHYAYYNYNHHYYGTRRHGDWRRNGGSSNPTGGPVVVPTPLPPAGGNSDNSARIIRTQTPSLDRLPPFAVVMASDTEFGTGGGAVRRAPLDIANQVLSKTPEIIAQSPPILPPIEEVRSKAKIDYGVSPPVWVNDSSRRADVKTGAMERKVAQPLDDTLRRERIQGNRPPLAVDSPRPDQPPQIPSADEPRRTGAFDRPVRRTPPASETPPIYEPPSPERKDDADRHRDEQPKSETPRPPLGADRRGRGVQPPYEPSPSKDDRPVHDPRPPRREERPRYEPPQRREQPAPPPPKNDPPPSRPEQKPQERPLPTERKPEKDDGKDNT